MDLKKILRATDHTLLRPAATWLEIESLLEEAMIYDCASACIPPSYVMEAVSHVGNALPICTVIGFHSGYDTPGS